MLFVKGGIYLWGEKRETSFCLRFYDSFETNTCKCFRHLSFHFYFVIPFCILEKPTFAFTSFWIPMECKNIKIWRNIKSRKSTYIFKNFWSLFNFIVSNITLATLNPNVKTSVRTAFSNNSYTLSLRQ